MNNSVDKSFSNPTLSSIGDKILNSVGPIIDKFIDVLSKDNVQSRKQLDNLIDKHLSNIDNFFNTIAQEDITNVNDNDHDFKKLSYTLLKIIFILAKKNNLIKNDIDELNFNNKDLNNIVDKILSDFPNHYNEITNKLNSIKEQLNKKTLNTYYVLFGMIIKLYNSQKN